MDMEKVVNGLNHCFHGQECCGDTECPYYIEHLSDSCCLEDCQENLKADTLALLKEQEAVKPETGHWIEHEGMQGEYYDCSACDYSLMEIHRGMKYCPYCGAKMDNPM